MKREKLLIFMRFFAISLLSLLYCNSAFAQKIDTVYYDKDGVGISTPAFASYYRVYSPNTLIGNKMRYRDFYLNGVLKSEGEYISIDTENDENTVFDGECTSFYESGKIKEKKNLSNGILNGEYTSYYESGLVELHTFFDYGKKHGIDTYFDKTTQRCYQKVMKNNEAIYDYCIISDENGYVSKVKLSNQVVIWDNPKSSDLKSFWSNDDKWYYYQTNGILIALKKEISNDYGKWFRITVNVSNHTLVPIDFGCDNFYGYIINKKGKNPLSVYDASLFMKKVKNKQRAELFAAGILEGLSAAAAGFSSSTTHTSTNYSGHSNSYGNVSAYGSGGYGYASYNGSTNYSGHSSSTSTTTSYNGFAAYQAHIIASNRLASMEDAMFQERAQRYEGYLKKTTIRPGETVSGYLNIMRQKGDTMQLIVDIYGAKYEFNWNVK